MIKKAWLSLADRFDACSPRERLMITLTSVAVLAAIFHFTVFAPTLARYESAQTALQADNQALRALEASEVALVGAAAQDPDAVVQKDLASVRDGLNGAQARLSRSNAALIDPARAVQLLRSLIATRKGLELVSMQAGEVVDLLAPTVPNAAASAPAIPVQSLYRHSVRIVLRGGYASLNRYVAEVEALPWRPRVEELKLVTDGWPQARLDLTLQFTSLERAWLAF